MKVLIYAARVCKFPRRAESHSCLAVHSDEMHGTADTRMIFTSYELASKGALILC